MTDHSQKGPKRSLALGLLTISDTRTTDTDKSGAWLANAASAQGHRIAAREICRDNLYALRAVVSHWIADSNIEVIITTGGTGLRSRDVTPEAISPLLDQPIDGFAELFRAASIADIGSSALQSRALAGMANRTLVCCLPGSTGACMTAWESILREQLDSSNRPCNFSEVIGD
ncbi:MAG: molybdenum cofactor biosynthesis protein B [Lysobacterales bacterium]